MTKDLFYRNLAQAHKMYVWVGLGGGNNKTVEITRDVAWELSEYHFKTNTMIDACYDPQSKEIFFGMGSLTIANGGTAPR